MPAIPDRTRRRWEASGNKSQRAALHIAAWAATRPPGTIVPAIDVLIAANPKVNDRYGMPSPNNPAAIRRAISLLAGMGILHRDRDTGHYHVAATGPAGSGPAGSALP